MLTWPHAQSDWKDHLVETEKTYIEMTREISRREIVLLVCFDKAHQMHVRHMLNDASVAPTNLRFACAPSNDSWSRDHAPLTIMDESTGSPTATLLDFTFNGWGNKYPAERDNAITRTLSEANIFGDTQVRSCSLVLEGGSVESDGQGTLLATTSSLLNPNRNPHLSQQSVEKELTKQLGIKRFLWLAHGHMIGDDTDGHIDTLARFCDAKTIAYTCCEDRNDEHYDSLHKMEAELQAFKATDNQPYKLVPLPLPSPIFNTEGERLPANYTNFLIINQAVLVPVYNDINDNIALQRLQTCFPTREIIGIDCRSLIQQFGSLHCATMQFPDGVLT